MIGYILALNIMKTTSCNIQRFFSVAKFEKKKKKKKKIWENDLFNLFAQKRDCGYPLEPPRFSVTSTHNLSFGSKIRKIGLPLQTPVFYIQIGFKGVYISRTCFQDIHFTDMFP